MEEPEYIRIGTTYYRVVKLPEISSNNNITLLIWDRRTIIEDYGSATLKNIPKYKGFCNIPSHIKYQQNVDGFYNLYHPLPHKPLEEDLELKELESHIPNSIKFMNHIFGEQVEMGFDYLKLLYELPAQPLPVLCLVSEERNTGKTTSLKWLNNIFGRNLTYIKGDSFNSQFNADWTGKLLGVVDEVIFEEAKTTEKIKFYATTNKDKKESKGKDRVEVDFFTKLILCSNNEYNFIVIDSNETRFWVRNIPVIETENTEFLKELNKEIPHLLSFLMKRELSTTKKSRLWFDPALLRTKALERLMFKNNNALESRMIEAFYELFESAPETEYIDFVPQDLINILNRLFRNNGWTRNDVRKVLKNNWGLEPKKQTLSYKRIFLTLDGDYCETGATGRYYRMDKPTILLKFDELMRE